jgi:hypothetical protein
MNALRRRAAALGIDDVAVVIRIDAAAEKTIDRPTEHFAVPEREKVP